MELTQGERAALMLIVRSGRAMVLASHLNTSGSDGRVVVPEGKMNRDLPEALRRPVDLVPQFLPPDEAVPVDATTPEGLAARKLVELWAVGVVVQFNRKERRKLAVRQVVATLTPYAASILGVRIVERGRDEAPVWGEPGAQDGEPKVRHEGNPYPEPFPMLVAVPDEAKGKRKSRRAG